MNTRFYFWAALFVLGSNVFFAQKVAEEKGEEKVNRLGEVVISDSKFKLKREQSGKVITKITAKELEQSQGQSVASVLNRVAGVSISGSNSAAGANLGYYIRGGRNHQVVIRIDGVTVSDPSMIADDFDLRLLSVDQIEEIEVLKGASSTLYGSGAATAVVNIISKSESKEKIAAHFASSIGTNQSQEDQDYDVNEFINLVSVNGTVGKVNYVARFGNQFSDGLSGAKKLPNDNSDTNFDVDAFSKFNVHAKVGYEWNTNFKFHFFGDLNHFLNEYDQGAGIDGDNNAYSRQYRGGSNWEIKYTKGSFVFVDSYSLFERIFESNYPSKTESRLYTFDAYNRYSFTDKLYTVFGVNGSFGDYNGYSSLSRGGEFVQNINDKVANFDIMDPYLNVVYVSDYGLNINMGTRLNIHSEYGSHLVFSFNPSYSYKFNDNYVKGLASYSTAFITPSLYQLYAPNFGNKELNPEENTTLEGGVELSLKSKFRVSVVYFNRTEENFIKYVNIIDFVSQYQNVKESFTTDGVELEFNTKFLSDKLILKGNATYTKVDKDLSNIRIPKVMVNASVGYQVLDKTYTSISYQFNDEMEDSYYNSKLSKLEIISLDSYGVLDFYVSHQLIKHLSLYAAIHNVTNQDYQEFFGYSSRGRNVRVGLNLKF